LQITTEAVAAAEGIAVPTVESRDFDLLYTVHVVNDKRFWTTHTQVEVEALP
jgi:hypothetical protein